MVLKTWRKISARMNQPLEDVLYMPIGQEFIFRRGQKPVICQRYRTPEDPTYILVTEQHRKRLNDCRARA